MQDDQPHEPFSELNRAVSEGRFTGPPRARQRRLFRPAEQGTARPDELDAYIDAAVAAFESRLREILERLEEAGLDAHEVLGPPEQLAERAARAAVPRMPDG